MHFSSSLIVRKVLKILLYTFSIFLEKKKLMFYKLNYFCINPNYSKHSFVERLKKLYIYILQICLLKVY